MPALLDIPEVRERISRISVEEYHQLGEYNQNGRRTELMRGIIIEKVSKSPLHSTLGSLLYKLIFSQVAANFLVRKDEPLTFADSEPEPDVSVVHGRESDFKNAHPSTAELVVEVAVSSVALDRENASLYAEANVKEYWIVLGRESRIEVYREPKNGRYQQFRVYGAGETLVCASIPGLQLRLSELFGLPGPHIS